MVPNEYRLEQVVASLVERLDGARQSYADPASAEASYRRIAEAHVVAAAAEWRGLEFADEPERQAAFLEQEVLETFLPRWNRIAWALTEAEHDGYGLGKAADPVGRFGLVGVALVGLFFLSRFAAIPLSWPILLAMLSVPFWPDIAAALHQRRYRVALTNTLSDMARIQDQFEAYAPVADPFAPSTGTTRRQPPPTQREGS